MLTHLTPVSSNEITVKINTRRYHISLANLLNWRIERMIIQLGRPPLRTPTAFHQDFGLRVDVALSATAPCRKDITMKQFTSNPQDSETAGHNLGQRFTELADQSWTRSKSRAVAKNEGIELNDEHWAVVVFLRKHYLHHGLPTHARITAKALSENFASLGGNKYLHRLFSGGPVTQGSRFANLRTPAYATDLSFGSSY